MKASDFIKELQEFPQDKEIHIFTESDSIPYKVKRIFHDNKFNGEFSFIVVEQVEE